MIKRKSTSIYIKEENKKLLYELADYYGISRDSMIEILLRDYDDKKKKEKSDGN